VIDKKRFLDILLVRKWMEGEIAKARELNLPAFDVGWEMMVNGIPLMAPSCTLEQAREIVGAMVNDWLTKSCRAATPVPAPPANDTGEAQNG
jgi:hypothetical protein